VPAFDDAYLIHLGDNLTEVEFDQATQLVAEYLRLNMLSPARGFFEACREANGEPTPSLRSFGLYQRPAAPSEFCDEFARMVTQQVLSSWRSADRKPSSNGALEHAGGGTNAVSGTEQLVRRLQLDPTGIAANARALIEIELGTDAASFLETWLADQTGAGDATSLPIIDKLFGPGDATGSDGGSSCTLQGKPVAETVKPFAEKLSKEIRRWTLAHVDERPGRIEAARQAVAWLLSSCDTLSVALQRFRSAAAEYLVEFRREVTIRASAGQGGAALLDQQQLVTYFCLRLDQAALFAAAHVVHLLTCDAKRLSEEITSLGREIEQISAAFSRANGDTNANLSNQTTAASAATQAHLAKSFQARLPEIAAAVDQLLQAEYINPQGGLAKVITAGGRPRAQLTAKLHELARQLVQRALAGFHAFEQPTSLSESLNDELRAGLSAATPALLEFGGTRHVMAIVPPDAAASLTPKELAKSLGVPATTVGGGDNNFALCVEAGQLSVPHVAASLVEYRRDRVEFAGRVHSRTDVAWTPLIELNAAPELTCWPGTDAPQTAAGDATCKTLVI
jgi:hypothetical protein